MDSVRAARELMEMGFQQVLILKNGYSAWKKAGYPLEPKKRETIGKFPD